MMITRQVRLLVLIFGLGCSFGSSFEFKPLSVRKSVFDKDLGMLDREREDYATALANFAANHVAKNKASNESLLLARRALGLALHLAPRNKKSVVLRFQLEKGVMPKPVDPQYSPQALSSLFMYKAKILKGQKGESNELLKFALTDLAAVIDPYNEDAIYAFELQKIDHGPVPWTRFTDRAKKPSGAPAESDSPGPAPAD